jgi:hypothetical protein
MRGMPRGRSLRPAFTLRWVAVALLVFAALLYYRPLRAYVHAHKELGSRQTDVRVLEAEKLALERKLAASRSAVVLAREARRLGYVRPGEHLYIVKGIDAWRRRLRATLRGRG